MVNLTPSLGVDFVEVRTIIVVNAIVGRQLHVSDELKKKITFESLTGSSALLLYIINKI